MAPTAVEYWPSMHSLHAASPISGLYLPATHNMHAVPSGPVDPVLLPMVGEYSPSAQLLQIALPLEVL
jgi:hypothetical protein